MCWHWTSQLSGVCVRTHVIGVRVCCLLHCEILQFGPCALLLFVILSYHTIQCFLIAGGSDFTLTHHIPSWLTTCPPDPPHTLLTYHMPSWATTCPPEPPHALLSHHMPSWPTTCPPDPPHAPLICHMPYYLNNCEPEYTQYSTQIQYNLYTLPFPLFPPFPLVHCSVNITIFDSGGTKHNIRGKVGDNILYLAHRYGIDMEGEFIIVLLCSCVRVCVCECIWIWSDFRWIPCTMTGVI